MCDKIVIFRKGRVVQYDTPLNILINPINEYVKSFLGTDRALKLLNLIKVQKCYEKNTSNFINIDTPTDEINNLLREIGDEILFVLKEGKPIGYLSKSAINILSINLYKSIKPFPVLIEETYSLNEVMAYMLMYENYYFPVINSNGEFWGLLAIKY